MKGEVPGCEPGIFPLVRHRDHIGGHQVTPTAVAAVLAALGRRRLGRIAIEPMLHIEVVELLVPQHPGECLALYTPHVLVADACLPGTVEGIRLGNSPDKGTIEAGEASRPVPSGGEPHPDRDAV